MFSSHFELCFLSVFTIYGFDLEIDRDEVFTLGSGITGFPYYSLEITQVLKWHEGFLPPPVWKKVRKMLTFNAASYRNQTLSIEIPPSILEGEGGYPAPNSGT